MSWQLQHNTTQHTMTTNIDIPVTDWRLPSLMISPWEYAYQLIGDSRAAWGVSGGGDAQLLYQISSAPSVRTNPLVFFISTGCLSTDKMLTAKYSMDVWHHMMQFSMVQLFISSQQLCAHPFIPCLLLRDLHPLSLTVTKSCHKMSFLWLQTLNLRKIISGTSVRTMKPDTCSNDKTLTVHKVKISSF